MANTKEKSANRDAQQYQKFKDAARELGCDDDEQAFDDKLRKISKAKVVEPAAKPKPSKEND